jgi:hypothetical protein
MARYVVVALALVAGCDGGGEEACVALVDGDWTIDGSAIGMPMGAVLTMDAEGCTFTFSDWSMEMNNLPAGGEVAGDQVTLTGGGITAGCVGTVNAEGTSAQGVCDDGSDFTMSQGALTGGGMSM